MSKRRLNLVLKLPAPYRLPTLSVAQLAVSGLCYEARYIAVEGTVVKVAGCAEGEEVLRCFRHSFAENLNF